MALCMKLEKKQPIFVGAENHREDQEEEADG